MHDWDFSPAATLRYRTRQNAAAAGTVDAPYFADRRRASFARAGPTSIAAAAAAAPATTATTAKANTPCLTGPAKVDRRRAFSEIVCVPGR